jgi:hypothetical protein
MRGQRAKQRREERGREAGVPGNTTWQPTKQEGRNKRRRRDERGRGGQCAGLWNFTSLGLPFSEYLAILAKSPPNKIPTKFHLLRRFPQNSICSGLGLNLDSSGIPPCVWCTTEWHHTSTKRKSHSLVWMTQSH